VIEDIRALTAQLAADPTSLVFLRLGEALRQRGQLDAAHKVAVSGLARYPHLPDAHDLYAKILTDQHDYANAFDEWDTVLRLAPSHVGANKGIGFLYYRAGDRESAIRHLKQALAADPGDEGLRAAIDRVGGGGEVWDLETQEMQQPPPPPQPETPRVSSTRAPTPSDPFFGLEGTRDRLMLVSSDGLRLGGGLANAAGDDVSEVAAALVSGAAREANRAAKLLDLGAWRHVTVECADLSFCLIQPTTDTGLIAAMEATLPVGQLHFLAERASKAATLWLERVR
jgi:tetratricopeptide (TPR) repeat protein